APGQRHIGGPAAPRYSATEAHRVEGRGRKVERRERPGRAERRLEGVADTQRKLEIGLRQAHLGAQVRRVHVAGPRLRQASAGVRAVYELTGGITEAVLEREAVPVEIRTYARRVATGERPLRLGVRHRFP